MALQAAAAVCVVVLLLGAFASGCTSCNDVGCGSGVRISVIGEGGLDLPVAEFEVVLQFDSRVVSCVLFAQDASADCMNPDGSSAGYTMFRSDIGGNLHLEVDVTETPTTVHVTVFQEGVEVVAEEFRPAYSSDTLEDSCGEPTCENATLLVAIPVDGG